MPAIITYFEQLEHAARAVGVDLKRAFSESAGLSAYWRAKGGADLHLDTAHAVHAKIHELAEAQAA